MSTLPADAPDAWVRMTAFGILHFLPAGEITTSCGVPARRSTGGMRAADVDQLPDFERPKRCHTCLTVARKVGHK